MPRRQDRRQSPPPANSVCAAGRCRFTVCQRANLHGDIGPPKSEAGERTLPLPPIVVNCLKQWKLRCPKGQLGLAFPDEDGNVLDHWHIIASGLKPALLAAGVVDQNGRAKYSGLHGLRHFFASWCINAKDDGGLELPPKTVQGRLGHSSITVTMDTYGHLFPTRDDGGAFAAAADALAGLHAV